MIGKQLRLNGLQLFGSAIDENFLDSLFMKYIQIERQTDAVVQVSVAQKDMKLRRLKTVANSKEPGPCVQHHSRLRNHKAGRVPLLVGVISRRAQ